MLIWYNTFFVNYPLFYCTYWPHFPFFKRINEVSLNNKNRNCARKHFDWLDWIETCFEQPKRQNHLDEAKNRSKKQNKMKWCGKMWIKREYAAVFLTRGRGPLSSRSILLGLILLEYHMHTDVRTGTRLIYSWYFWRKVWCNLHFILIHTYIGMN